jgi:hypothetical protein
MLQQQSQASTAKSQQSPAPVAPAAKTAPVPLDPSLLRHVGGGAETPVKGW